MGLPAAPVTGGVPARGRGTDQPPAKARQNEHGDAPEFDIGFHYQLSGCLRSRGQVKMKLIFMFNNVTARFGPLRPASARFGPLRPASARFGPLRPAVLRVAEPGI
jgi:hypothetical protein